MNASLKERGKLTPRGAGPGGGCRSTHCPFCRNKAAAKVRREGRVVGEGKSRNEAANEKRKEKGLESQKGEKRYQQKYFLSQKKEGKVFRGSLIHSI